MKNPISEKWYADPEARVYGDTVYMYVTHSLPFEDQKNLDVVTTSDLEHFEEHYNILDMSTFSTATFAVWAPTVIEKSGKYYIIFAANCILEETDVGGLYIGVADSPLGPFKNVLADGKPLLNRIYNNAQPIDAHLFKDDDGTIYLYYGGWGHMMVCVMNETMDGFMPMAAPCIDGVVRELTPADYVEAPYVEKIDGKYHLMYSTGCWGDGTYCVKAAVADDPMGTFTYYADILTAAEIADGPGHNGAFFFKGKHYTAYHRRTVGDAVAEHRRLCIDEQSIEGGRFHPVIMT